MVPSPQLQRTIVKKKGGQAGLLNMAIYPASEVLNEGVAFPSSATGFTVEPDPSLPSITPSPPKPHSPRAHYHHQHQSNQLASSLEIMSFTFIPLSLPFFQPFPAPHCYLPK